MRIVAVTAGFPLGAGEAFLLPELLELQRQGHEITIVPMRAGGQVLSRTAGQLMDRVRAEGLASPAVLAATANVVHRAPGIMRRAVVGAVRAPTRRSRATNLALLPKGCYLARLAETICAEHLHAYWAAGPATAAMLAAELTGIPWSFTAHRWDIWENNLLVDKLRTARGARLISEDGRRLLDAVLARDGLPEPERRGLVARTRVIHLGVEAPSAPPVEPVGETLLCPAALVPVKGHAYLIEAFRRVAAHRSRARLLLAGEGALRESLSAQVEQTGLGGRVRFLGHLPHDDLLDLYNGQVRCVVLASITLGPGHHEGIPVSLVEAMAHGIPVVATATGGIPELVGPDRGVLVPERDPGALAEGIERLLDSPNEWRRLAGAGRRFVALAFDVRRTTADLVALMAGEPAGDAESAPAD